MIEDLTIDNIVEWLMREFKVWQEVGLGVEDYGFEDNESVWIQFESGLKVNISIQES